MANLTKQKQKQTDKSYRALVGIYGNGAAPESCAYLLDSNDTAKYYAFFSMSTGLSPQAEAHCKAFFSKNVEPYADTMRQDVFGKPNVFVKSMLEALVKELQQEGLVEAGSGDYSIMAALVKSGNLVIGRVNNLPVYVLKDRKLKKAFRDVSEKGLNSVQVVGATVGSDDMLLAGTTGTLKHLTDLELRRIMLLESDLSLVCSRINMQANKYEETADPRILAMRLRKARGENKQFTLKTAGVMAALGLIIMIVLMWGDISRYVVSGPGKILFGENQGLRKIARQMSIAKMKDYEPELVYEGLSVPYDLAVDKDGVLYIVDDKEEQIIRYDTNSKQRTLIGDQVKLVFPTGIETLGDTIYVADFSRQVNRVYEFSKSGAYIGRIPGDNDKNTSFSNPKALAVDPKENALYVCDRGNNRVVKFGSGGGEAKAKIELPAEFKEPNGIAVSNNGTMYISMKMSGQIGKIASMNHVTKFELFKEGEEGSEKITLAKPSGVAVDSKGNLYIADTTNQRVLVADETGRLIGEIDREKIKEFETYYPMSVKIDPTGENVYIIAGNRYSYDVTCKDQCKGKIWRIKT